MTQPAFAESPEPGEAFRLGQRGADNVLGKYLPRHFNGRQLKIFFGAEVSKEAALAHLEFVRQPSDGKSFQTFHRSQVHSNPQDALPRARPFGPAPFRLRWNRYCHPSASIVKIIIARTFVFVQY